MDALKKLFPHAFSATTVGKLVTRIIVYLVIGIIAGILIGIIAKFPVIICYY